MENYSLAMKWIESLIFGSSLQKKDKSYFVCTIALLKYKIHVQYQMDDETISDCRKPSDTCLLMDCCQV